MSEPERALVQGHPHKHYPGTISWAEHLEAWKGYASKHGTQQSALRIHERGGFGYDELWEYLGHRPTTWERR